MTMSNTIIIVAAVAAVIEAASGPPTAGEPWAMHIIDNSSRGADGVRLADVNGDGRPDIATGWEEGGRIAICLNPGPAESRKPWPAVTVGRVGNPEDAVLVDLDGDGAMDVVSACEGSTRTLYVHWAPREPARYADPSAWKTEPIPFSRGLQMWMYCLPLQIDGVRGVDLVAGGKNGARLGWIESPRNPRDLAAWTWHPLCDVGWVMSIASADMDGDGDADLVVTDRKGPASGCFWLENPGPGPAQALPWARHDIGGQGREVMFLVLADLDRDGLQDVLVATKPRTILWLRRLSPDGRKWETRTIQFPESAGTAKGLAVGDIDGDGRPDIVVSCEGAAGARPGVLWLSCRNAPTDAEWDAHDISGPPGTKYDLLELLDMDGDGDLDVLACEEAENLGVFWYENPRK